ncbi:uncharacterized protein EDB91DRAFT_487811 [Suillus paluster]|uniref:uncharacterized protein n=1 Tax=Suillus paluster TaxID=48578 RepID=UPI001B886431|nr:uncharacterized protein EDB91DRAFT_487811 [Suillus paluster]KAG1737065.1 hypothetical protein EDB91DRAFT_487811 [Suillus paluster]
MNVTTLSATDFPIKSVKIFSSHAAEVTRVFPLDFTQLQSPNESQAIKISMLPALYPGGLRVSVTTGSDDVLIMDYYHTSPVFGNIFNTSRNQPIVSDVLCDLTAKCTRLEDERRLRQQSFAFLSTYMNALAKGDAPSAEPAQLVTFFDEFVEIGKNQSEVIAVLDQQIKDVQKEIEKENWRLQDENFGLRTTVTVVLAPVSGRTATAAELELKYRVFLADGWKPVYELHVTTIDSVPSSSVSLTYRCQISQFTRENWENVELSVTTAEPDLPLVGLPKPKKLEIRQRGLVSQPDSYHQQASRPTQLTPVWHAPIWNAPGYASPFGNILSSSQQAGQSLFGSAQSAAHQADPSQGSTGAAQGPASSNLFGAFQRQPTTTTQGLFGSTPAQSDAGQGMFGASGFHLSAQPQASSPTITLPPPYSSTRNSSVSSFSRSATTENTLGFNRPAPNLHQSQTFASSSTPAQPSSPQHQHGERAMLAELDKDVTHSATAKVFIPSRQGFDIHHVLIATIPLTASFTRVAVPSVDTRVFFTCEIPNTSNYVLTPGIVHIYLDGRHVSDCNITSANQPQTIQCSLGVDPGVTTQFNRTVDSLLRLAVVGDRTVTAHTITTTITNTHQDPVSNVIVRTSLPIPADPRITVSLQEPEGLADIASGTVRVRDGCYARWSTTGDHAGKNEGLFEWVCSNVKPGSEVLKAVWYVTAPHDLSFTEE